MKYLKQAFIIIVITLIAEVLSHTLPLPLPASIYGMLILFVCLITGVIKMEQVENVGEWLIAVMPAMFVVPGAGFITSWASLQPHLLSWSVIISVTTVLVMAVAGLVAQSLQKRQDAKNGGKK
ncbi:CidA/LrgA family protein [Aerococcus viridans]|uniref:CidA/LrgA family protein n=1 Tax=Aerococcus viridans TaxID=1377 RepID=A0A2J9PM35_9LACT|nr:CidA/LrgA family protein [Aerococcus viridans]MCT1798193.1 CidA/LrgA family protein [Aerococcus viridans]PNL91409.1 CidA/LrgA family protein [Aerococcus viridans]